MCYQGIGCPLCGKDTFRNIESLLSALANLEIKENDCPIVSCDWKGRGIQQLNQHLCTFHHQVRLTDEDTFVNNLKNELLSSDSCLEPDLLSSHPLPDSFPFNFSIPQSQEFPERLPLADESPVNFPEDGNQDHAPPSQPESGVHSISTSPVFTPSSSMTQLSLTSGTVPQNRSSSICEGKEQVVKTEQVDSSFNINFVTQPDLQPRGVDPLIKSFWSVPTSPDESTDVHTENEAADTDLSNRLSNLKTDASPTSSSAFSSFANRTNRKNRNKQMKSTHQSVCETAVECKDCGLRFDNVKFLNLHRILLHCSKQNRVFQLKVYKCCHCSLEVENYDDFLEHLDKMHDDQRHVCKFCNKMFKLRGSLLVHQRVIHHNTANPDPRNKQVLDNEDPENSQDTKVFASIQNDEIDQDEGVCDDAQFKDVPTPSYKQDTISMPTSPEKGEIIDVNQLQDVGHEKSCNMCTKTFTDNQEFVKHVKIHQESKQFDCSVCNKKFTTKYFLKKHRRLHTGETPYTCELCGKTFVFQQSYHKHMLYHTDDKPYSCSTCGRAFKELSTLQNHERIHTGERPFVCDFCGKSFRQRVSYLVHRRIHTGALPYVCDFCGKKFRYKVTQRTHKCPGRADIESEANSAQTRSPQTPMPNSLSSTPIRQTPPHKLDTNLTNPSPTLQQGSNVQQEPNLFPMMNRSPDSIDVTKMMSDLNSQQIDMKPMINAPKQPIALSLLTQSVGEQQLNLQKGSFPLSQECLPSTSNQNKSDNLMSYRDPSSSVSPPHQYSSYNSTTNNNNNNIPTEIRKNIINFRRAQGKKRLGHRLQNILQRSKSKTDHQQQLNPNASKVFVPELQSLSINPDQERFMNTEVAAEHEASLQATPTANFDSKPTQPILPPDFMTFDVSVFQNDNENDDMSQ